MYSLLIVSFIKCHLVLDIPEVWGIEDSVSLETPLDKTTSNPVCAGKNPAENGVVTFAAGQTYDFNVVCGEKDLNAGGCLTGDWHSGGNNDDYAGCALGVNYGDYQNLNDYKYISYSNQCARRGSPSSFVIVENARNCEKCVCSWSWAPSRMYSSPGQFYHNCFYCSITGGSDSDSSMKQLDFINIQNSQFDDLVYNDLNLESIYDVNLPEPESEPDETPETEPESEPDETPETEPESEPDEAPEATVQTEQDCTITVTVKR